MNIVEILTNGFLVQVMAGMLMNLQIAAVALALGLVFGLPLAWAHLRGGYICPWRPMPLLTALTTGWRLYGSGERTHARMRFCSCQI